MNSWKLPSYLEPYRNFIEIPPNTYESIEDVVNHSSVMDQSEYKIQVQYGVCSILNLLQRLYDAKKLK